MEEKLLKAKELKELLFNLKKIDGQINVIPDDSDNVKLELWAKPSGYTIRHFMYQGTFHSYCDDPTKCTLAFLRDFFSDPEIAEHISSPINQTI